MISLEVWRHTCLSIGRLSGRIKVVENGQVYVDKYSQVIIDNMKQIQLQVKNFYVTLNFEEMF